MIGHPFGEDSDLGGWKLQQARSWALYAIYMAAVVGLGVFCAGAFLASKMRGTIGDQATIRGSWLVDEAHAERTVLAPHAVSHVESRGSGFSFEVYTDSRGLRVSAPD